MSILIESMTADAKGHLRRVIGQRARRAREAIAAKAASDRRYFENYTQIQATRRLFDAAALQMNSALALRQMPEGDGGTVKFRRWAPQVGTENL